MRYVQLWSVRLPINACGESPVIKNGAPIGTLDLDELVPLAMGKQLFDAAPPQAGLTTVRHEQAVEAR